MAEAEPQVNDNVTNPTEEGFNSQSSVAAFKKRAAEREKGTVLELSEGVKVLVKRPRIKKLIAQGIIPDSLAATMVNAASSGQKSVNPKQIPELIDLQEIIAMNTVVSPKVVKGKANYDEGEISIDDLDDMDINTIWDWVQGGVKAVDSFRENGQGITSGPNSETLSE